jgi:hypothetical protein
MRPLQLTAQEKQALLAFLPPLSAANRWSIAGLAPARSISPPVRVDPRSNSPVILSLAWLAGLSIPAGAQGTSQAPLPLGAWRIAGEFGARAEFIANENFAETDVIRADDARFRLRLRARLGAEYRATEAVTVALRVSTGDNAFPSSAWTSLSSDFRRQPVQLDRAYVQLRLRALQLRAGIGPNPLFTPTELLWDADVQPAGLTQRLAGSNGSVALTLGQFVLREVRSSRPPNERSSFLLVEGVTYRGGLGAATATVGLAHYYFTNPDAIARSLQTGELDGEFKTNRFDPNGRTLMGADGAPVPTDYFSRFSVLSVGWTVEVRRIPLTAGGDVAVNLGARRDAALGAAYAGRRNVAFGAMVRYGRSTSSGGVTLGLGFFRIEADAVLAVYNSDDLQQTNVTSVPLEVVLALPGRTRLLWDTYVQKKISTALPSNGGLVHGQNALKVRTRLSLLVGF